MPCRRSPWSLEGQWRAASAVWRPLCINKTNGMSEEDAGAWAEPVVAAAFWGRPVAHNSASSSHGDLKLQFLGAPTISRWRRIRYSAAAASKRRRYRQLAAPSPARPLEESAAASSALFGRRRGTRSLTGRLRRLHGENSLLNHKVNYGHSRCAVRLGNRLSCKRRLLAISDQSDLTSNLRTEEAQLSRRSCAALRVVENSYKILWPWNLGYGSLQVTGNDTVR